jgi:hypothetical protein
MEGSKRTTTALPKKIQIKSVLEILFLANNKSLYPTRCNFERIPNPSSRNPRQVQTPRVRGRIESDPARKETGTSLNHLVSG